MFENVSKGCVNEMGTYLKGTNCKRTVLSDKKAKHWTMETCSVMTFFKISFSVISVHLAAVWLSLGKVVMSQ